MISDNVHGLPERLTPDSIVKQALRVGALYLSEAQVNQVVGPTEKEEEMKENSLLGLKNARDANLVPRACEMRDNFVLRESKRRRQTITLPPIESLRVFTQGNYTVALLNGEYVGVSKKMKKDKFNFNTGLNKAIYRAVRRLVLSRQ